MELKSRIPTTVYAPFAAEAAGTIIGVWRAEGVLCGLASVQWGGVTVWQCSWGRERSGNWYHFSRRTRVDRATPLLPCARNSRMCALETSGLRKNSKWDACKK